MPSRHLPTPSTGDPSVTSLPSIDRRSWPTASTSSPSARAAPCRPPRTKPSGKATPRSQDPLLRPEEYGSFAGSEAVRKIPPFKSACHPEEARRRIRTLQVATRDPSQAQDDMQLVREGYGISSVESRGVWALEVGRSRGRAPAGAIADLHLNAWTARRACGCERCAGVLRS